MIEMIERVALAISGGDDPKDILGIHRTRARLAILAMREPTEAMWQAAFQGGVDCVPQMAWRAMIDEALNG